VQRIVFLLIHASTKTLWRHVLVDIVLALVCLDVALARYPDRVCYFVLVLTFFFNGKWEYIPRVELIQKLTPYSGKPRQPGSYEYS